MTDNPFGTPAEDDDHFEVDLPEDDGSGFMVPEGDYIGCLVDLEKGFSQAGNPMWTWTFKLVQGEQEGREFKLFTALTPAAMWKVREVIEALGLGTAGKTSKWKKSDAIGRMCTLTMVDDEYQGVKRSSINKTTPHPGGVGTRYSGPE